MKKPEYKDHDKQAGRLMKQKDIFFSIAEKKYCYHGKTVKTR
jgi:hypothetical protein